MPGTYTGEYMILRAPSAGEHVGKHGTEQVCQGDTVYMHPGHVATFGNLQIAYPHNKEGRPYIEFKLDEEE